MLDIPMHVDAASGGFIAPFLQTGLIWDFRVAQGEIDQRFRNIKMALVYRVWDGSFGVRQKDLPEDLSFAFPI